MSSTIDSKPVSRMLQRSDSKRNMLSRGESHRNVSNLVGQSKATSSTQLLNSEQVKPAGEYFTTQHLHDRMRQYAQEAGIPAEFIERYSQESKSPNSPLRGNNTESLKKMMEED